MSERTVEYVRERYAGVARSGFSSDQEGVRAVAEAFGYTPEELRSIPAEANMGLSCGNPTAMANLREGEVVVDLGSGGGLDVFLAAQRVGLAGRAIGIDMTPEMIALARRNAEKRNREGAADNVEFHLATIDRIPLGDATADVIISNCVINLAPDKPAVFREMARVLKPGGRLAISDIALKRSLPPELAGSLEAYAGCVAGAITFEDYRRGLVEAGFAHVEIVDSGADLNAYAKAGGESSCCAPAETAPAPEREASGAYGCCGPAPSASACCAPEAPAGEPSSLSDLLRRYDANAYAASVRVFAVKP